MDFVKALMSRFGRSAKDPLTARPRPFVHPDLDLVVLWSAKSACTTTFVWFANVAGLLPDLIASGRAPHEYRRHVYVKTPAYRKALERGFARLPVLHVVRDPYQRAVSCYRHALRTGYEDARLREGTAVGPMDREAGFSFARYLDYLATIDLEQGSPHHRPQWHPLEAVRPPDRVINISRENLFESLDAFAAEAGLPRTDFAAMDWLHAFEARRRAAPAPVGAGDVPNLPFDRRAASGDAPWPETERFLTAPIRRRIETLYRVDFDNLGRYL